MNDGDALLAAILANPDDDTPRLVYADWLQEHGDADRAEFIRLQCGWGDDAAEGHAAELEERHRGEWLAGLPQFAGSHWEFRRGFPEVFMVDGEFFLDRYQAFARVPWVRRLRLDGLQNWMLRDFVNRTWKPNWVELELHIGGVGDYTSGVTALARCSQTRQLRWLRLVLTNSPLNAEACAELADSPDLGDLQTFEIVGAMSLSALDPLWERFGDRLVVASR